MPDLSETDRGSYMFIDLDWANFTTTGTTVSSALEFSPLAEYVTEKSPEKQQKLALNLQHIRWQLIDILAEMIKGTPSAMRRPDFSICSNNPSARYNYQRANIARQGHYIIFYKDQPLVQVQCRPTPVFTSMRPTKPKARLVHGLLLNIVHEYYPYAKVKNVK